MHFSSRQSHNHQKRTYLVVHRDARFLRLFGTPRFAGPAARRRPTVLRILRVLALGGQVAYVAEVVLHSLFEFVHLVNQHFFELVRVDLRVLFRAIPHLAPCRSILNLLNRVDWLSVCVLGADQPVLREVLPTRGHFHRGVLWLFNLAE